MYCWKGFKRPLCLHVLLLSWPRHAYISSYINWEFWLFILLCINIYLCTLYLAFYSEEHHFFSTLSVIIQIVPYINLLSFWYLLYFNTWLHPHRKKPAVSAFQCRYKHTYVTGGSCVYRNVICLKIVYWSHFNYSTFLYILMICCLAINWASP